MWVSIHPGVSLYESRPVEWRGSASSHGRSVGRSVVGHSTARAGGATTGTIESMALEALEEEEEDVFVVKDARGRVYGAVVNDGEDDAFFNARGAFDAVTTADAREALARACERLVRDGQAWWSPTDVPRCALEAFARAVWEKYSSAATGVDVDASGVEFWARESAAGLHWDKDEELIARALRGVGDPAPGDGDVRRGGGCGRGGADGGVRGIDAAVETGRRGREGRRKRVRTRDGDVSQGMGAFYV